VCASSATRRDHAHCHRQWIAEIIEEGEDGGQENRKSGRARRYKTSHCRGSNATKQSRIFVGVGKAKRAPERCLKPKEGGGTAARRAFCPPYESWPRGASRNDRPIAFPPLHPSRPIRNEPSIILATQVPPTCAEKDRPHHFFAKTRVTTRLGRPISTPLTDAQFQLAVHDGLPRSASRRSRGDGWPLPVAGSLGFRAARSRVKHARLEIGRPSVTGDIGGYRDRSHNRPSRGVGVRGETRAGSALARPQCVRGEASSTIQKTGMPNRDD